MEKEASSFPSSSLRIPDDPLISPLYEAMFPFSVFSNSTTTPCDALLPPLPTSCVPSPPPCLPSDRFIAALLDREVPIRIIPRTAESSSIYKQPPLYPAAEVAPHALVFDLQQLTNPPPPTATDEQKEPNKNKYYCEACRVGFRTSQALGGHMSSHSKVSRERPLLLPPSSISTALHQLVAAEQTGGRSSNKKKRKKSWICHRPISKKYHETSPKRA